MLNFKNFCFNWLLHKVSRDFCFIRIYSYSFNKKSYKIKSKGLIIRSYGSAEKIVELGLKWLFSDSEGFSTNATSFKIDLLQIANLINDIIGNIEIIHQIQDDYILSDYSANFKQFNKTLVQMGIENLSIKDQLKISIRGYEENFIN